MVDFIERIRNRIKLKRFEKGNFLGGLRNNNDI